MTKSKKKPKRKKGKKIPITEKRKGEHVDIVLNRNVQYQKSAGFELVSFIHNSLPETDFDRIDLSCKFIGKRIRFPVLITGMTGGYSGGEHINRELARAAENHGLAFGVGSQRAMIEDPKLIGTYAVRDVAPSIPLIANIGGVQLKKYGTKVAEHLVSKIEADALAIHLNPLQEMIQPEGDRDFTGVLKVIEGACNSIGVPVIVKETGAGISSDVAFSLKKAGVSYVDVSGAGGTSWSKVEYERFGMIQGFEEWGIPTVDSILMCRSILPVIASGGVRNGVTAAKAIALGADLAGAAYPFLRALESGHLNDFIDMWKKQMRIAAFLTGSKNYHDLKNAKMLFR